MRDSPSIIVRECVYVCVSLLSLFSLLPSSPSSPLLRYLGGR